MVEDFITIADGTTHVVFNGINAGTVSNVVYRNTDEAWREYQAMVLQSRYRFFDRLTVNGNYTVQLRNHGNYEGEGTNTPGSTLDHRRLSRGDSARPATTRRAGCRTSSATSCAPGRSTTWTSDAAAACRCRDSCASTRAWPTASPSATSPPTATQRAILTAAGYPDSLGTANVFFERARLRDVPRLRPARHLDPLQRAGVRRAPSVDQVRRLQPDEQPEAGRRSAPR